MKQTGPVTPARATRDCSARHTTSQKATKDAMAMLAASLFQLLPRRDIALVAGLSTARTVRSQAVRSVAKRDSVALVQTKRQPDATAALQDLLRAP